MVTSAYFKFWEECFRRVASGQQPLQAMADWIQSGCPPDNALAELLRRCYGLPASVGSGGDLWQQTVTDFLTALNTYAPLWGWVPLARYERLKRKAERQARTIAAQERTIQQLNDLLSDKGLGHAALMTRFQDLINDQTQAFDELMQTITEVDVDDASNPHRT